LVEERSDLQVCYLLSRAVSAQAVVVFINLTLSHQVEINQAFSLKMLQNVTQHGHRYYSFRVLLQMRK
jgi:hypothetical protein